MAADNESVTVVRVLRFPADLGEDLGVWVEAELRARQGAGWLQMESAPHRRPIGPGFRGVRPERAGGSPIGTEVAEQPPDTSHLVGDRAAGRFLRRRLVGHRRRERHLQFCWAHESII
jgi:hypothetical protein